VLTRTEEDRRRASMYTEQRRRQDLARDASDMESFLEGLASVATFHLDEPELLARTAQLCARTNQFNLSSRRHAEGDITRLICDDSARVVQMRAADRFGDLGVVGVAIVVREGTSARLDTFLLSCRALGRGFEEALLAKAWLMAAEQLGCTELLAEWLPNGRNEQVREFLARTDAEPAGESADGETWRIHRPPPWPEHVRREVV